MKNKTTIWIAIIFVLLAAFILKIGFSKSKDKEVKDKDSKVKDKDAKAKKAKSKDAKSTDQDGKSKDSKIKDKDVKNKDSKPKKTKSIFDLVFLGGNRRPPRSNAIMLRTFYEVLCPLNTGASQI